MDLTKLMQLIESSIPVDETVSFSHQELEKTDIEKLDNVKVTGKILRNAVGEIECDLLVQGTMILKDAISNEEVPYPFSFELQEEVEDFIEKNENMLAFKRLLWENIVLEVPIRYTTVKDYSTYKGDGWRLMDEEQVTKSNRPFEALLKEEE